MTPEITIGQQQVQIKGPSPEIVEMVMKFKPFNEWVERFRKEQESRQDEMDISSIEIQSTDEFSSNKLGFVKFKVNATFKDNGGPVPGIVFMRGGAVSVLIILRSSDNSNKEDRTVLTLQPRLPVACLSFPEIPAGMLDGDGSFTGAAAREIEEETGLKLVEKDLVDLTEMAYGERWGDRVQGMYPSAGGCDEFLRLFMSVKEMPEAEIQALEGRLGGLRKTGEKITLKVVPLKDAWKEAPDAKLLSSLALYHALKQEKKVE